MTTTPPGGDDDLDRRFAELVAQEFPEDRPASPRGRRRSPMTPPTPPLTLFDRMDAADDEEWEHGDNRVRPPALRPMRPAAWSGPVKLGTALMVLSVVLTLLLTFGVPFPAWVNTVAMVAFVVGLGTLLFRLVTAASPPRDEGDDGARL